MFFVHLFYLYNYLCLLDTTNIPKTNINKQTNKQEPYLTSQFKDECIHDFHKLDTHNNGVIAGVYVYVCMCVCVYVCMCVCVYVCLFVHLFIYLFIYLFIHSFMYLFISILFLSSKIASEASVMFIIYVLFIYLFIYLFVCLFI
jgi:hypothetical protein